MAAVRIYFAWVEETETTFIPLTHKREDEKVASIDVQHEENAFATATVVIKNPRKGFLHASSSQWAWISDDIGALFFGRLNAFPSSITKEVVTLDFEARPKDFQDRKETVADTLRTLPTWDPVMMKLDAQQNPDSVLEARPELWHIDRVTHAVTTSNILVGEDGIQEFQPNEMPYDSLDVNIAQVPAHTLEVTAYVSWTQTFGDTLDMGTFLIDTFTGASLFSNWPKTGANIGGGWYVADASISDNWNIASTETTSINLTWSNDAATHNTGDTLSMSLSVTRPTLQGGVPIEIPLTSQTKSGEEASVNSTSLLIAEWSLTGKLTIGYNAGRDRREGITFRVSANFQPLISLPDDNSVEPLELQGGDVGLETIVPGAPLTVEIPIGDAKGRSYFTTERGLRTLEWCLLRACAQLQLAGRAIEITVVIPYARARALSCRMNGRINDRRLPGGIATGKIIKYGFTADGDNGTRIGTMTVGIPIGYGGTVTEVAGTPDYVDDDYVFPDYQVHTGAMNTVDDGLSFPLTKTDIIQCEVVGNIAAQRAFLLSLIAIPSPIGGGAQLNEALTQVTDRGQTVPKQVDDGLKPLAHTLQLKLPNLDSGPFDNLFTVTVTQLELPQGIDLAADPL
jgi:hypothetical protein